MLWIDNSLSPLVAQALKIVGYNVVVQGDVEEFSSLPRVLDDQHIIPWLQRNDGIWVHADNSARREHRKQIAISQIRTLWIHRPDGKMSNREQLRVLAYVLPDALEDFAAPKARHRHFQVSVHGQPPHTAIRRSPLVLKD